MRTRADKSFQEDRFSNYVFMGGELHLSNLGQLELLRSMMERGVPLRTMVRGFSMHPFIRDGDVLTIYPVNGRKLSPGDVAAFIQPETGKLAIHRIVGKTLTGLMIRGDNCPQADGSVTPDNILGRVTRIERCGRTIRTGLGWSGVLIAALNSGDNLMRIKRLFLLPRRAASLALKYLQSFSFYRRFGRMFSLQTVIKEACGRDMEEVHNRFNPRSLYIRQPYNPHVTNWVAKNSGKIVGFVQLVYHPEEHYPWVGYWLFSLQVWSLFRGAGIGEKLAGRVIEKAADSGAKELFLTVFEDNKRAVSLYSKLGFTHAILEGLEVRLSSERHHSGRRRIVMKKDLK